MTIVCVTDHILHACHRENHVVKMCLVYVTIIVVVDNYVHVNDAVTDYCTTLSLFLVSVLPPWDHKLFPDIITVVSRQGFSSSLFQWFRDENGNPRTARDQDGFPPR